VSARPVLGGAGSRLGPRGRRSPGRPPAGLSWAATVLGSVAVAVAPVEVLSLNGFRGGFRLTPFLVVAPVYILLAAMVLVRSPPQGRDLGRQAPLLALIAAVAISSFLAGSDPFGLTWARAAESVFEIGFGILFVWSSVGLVGAAFARGVRAFLALDLSFVALQWALLHSVWLQALAAGGVGSYLHVWPTAVGGLLPRFNGLVADPNRAGVDVVLMTAFADCVSRAGPRGEGLPRWCFAVAPLLVVLTQSRTGLVALAVVAAPRAARAARRRPLLVGAGLVFTALLSAVALTAGGPVVRSLVYSLVTSPGRAASTREHFALIRRGIGLWWSSPKRVVFGVGWGTAYRYTAAFFGANKYGNFHSGFVSVLAEGGVLALVPYLFAVLWPGVRDRRLWALVAAVAWANVFYQYQMDPAYWIILASACGFPSAARRPVARLWSHAKGGARRDLVGQV
jgi:hypothetical protein